MLVDAREAEDLSSRGLEICRQVANIGDDTEADVTQAVLGTAAPVALIKSLLYTPPTTRSQTRQEGMQLRNRTIPRVVLEALSIF